MSSETVKCLEEIDSANLVLKLDQIDLPPSKLTAPHSPNKNNTFFHNSLEESEKARSNGSACEKNFTLKAEENLQNFDDELKSASSIKPEFPWKNEIRLGLEYQAIIPKLEDDSQLFEERKNDLSIKQWDGLSQCKLSLLELCHFEQVFNKIYLNGKYNSIDDERFIETDSDLIFTPDNEIALTLLSECNFSTDSVMDKLCTDKNIEKDLIVWCEEDVVNFEKGFAFHGKNFSQIKRTKLQNRSIVELIEFYYAWKKTQRCEHFLTICSRERRKYLLQPGLLEHLDCFLIDGEDLTSNYCLKAGFPGLNMLPDHMNCSSKSPHENAGYCQDVQDLLKSLISPKPINHSKTTSSNDNFKKIFPTPSYFYQSIANKKLSDETDLQPFDNLITADKCRQIITSRRITGPWCVTHTSLQLNDLREELEIELMPTDSNDGTVVQ